MPQTHPSDNRPPRAPVALLLTPTHRHRPTDNAGRALPDWYGVHPQHLARLIARYTRDGDIVLDTDGHLTVAAAADYLHRRHGRIATDRDAEPFWSEFNGEPPSTEWRSGAGLVLATLPRKNVKTTDPQALAHAVGRWSERLRRGGYLGVLFTTGPSTALRVHRSTVITAARAVGLRYHQHLPVVLIALPEVEPRTGAATAAHRPLRDGRHERTHRDLLIFATTIPEDADV